MTSIQKILFNLVYGALYYILRISSTFAMILVHVAAPSSATDDARYQAQVNALLTLPPISAMTPTFNANNATTMGTAVAGG